MQVWVLPMNETVSSYVGKAQRYAQFRWNYASAAIDWLCAEAGLCDGQWVADIGAGPGTLARRAAVGVATRHGGQIVQLVSETVRRWDARTVTDRIESAVGRDLQFIRINGTLVGGLVGMTIHFLDSVF